MANPASHPEGGVDYPRTLTEFDAWFVSETACAEEARGLLFFRFDAVLQELANPLNQANKNG